MSDLIEALLIAVHNVHEQKGNLRKEEAELTAKIAEMKSAVAGLQDMGGPISAQSVGARPMPGSWIGQW